MHAEMLRWSNLPIWSQRQSQRERLRTKLATFINAADASTIGFVANTTRAAQHVAWSFKWSPGDAIVLVRGEYPSNVLPWLQAAKAWRLDVCWVDAWSPETHEQWMTQLRGVLKTHRVRLMALSAVAFQTGWHVPMWFIAKTLHEQDARLYVDGIQACGVVPVDVTRTSIDFFGCGGHKWMMGTDGAGFLYVSPSAQETLSAHFVGASSTADDQPYLSQGAGHLSYDVTYRADASSMEGGSQNSLGYVAMEASLDILMSFRPADLMDHMMQLHAALFDGIHEIGHEHIHPLWSDESADHSGSFVCKVTDAALLQHLYMALYQQGIIASMPDGHLRFSPFWWHDPEEMMQVTEFLQHVLN